MLTLKFVSGLLRSIECDNFDGARPTDLQGPARASSCGALVIRNRARLLRSAGPFVILVAVSFALTVGGCASKGTSFSYPEARQGDQVDVYHGVKVADPYRWLEDPDSPETRAWIEAENKITFDYLGEIPARDKIKERITNLWDYEKYGVPYKEGGRYFYSKNDGLQDHAVLYWVNSLADEPKVLIDPNKLSEDGTVSLAGWSISDDGKLLAYGVSDAGSDWEEWHVRDIDTGKDFADDLKWIKFSGASWTKDGKGFYYSRYDEPKADAELQDVNYFNKLYYHRLETSQSQDELVYHRPDEKEWGINGDVTEDGRYLIISIRKGTERNSQVFYKDLQAEDSKIVELIAGFDAQYDFIGNEGPVFWLQTDLDAPQSRVLAIDLRKPERSNWKEIIPEAPETLRGVSLTGGRLVASYLKDAYSQVKIFDLDGKFVRNVEFPAIGSAYGFGGKQDDPETFYVFTGFSTPATIYRYDLATGDSTVFRQPDVDFDPSAYETRQVFYRSKDGTRVPMFIVHKKGLRLDGNNPTLLYGYGGFDIALTPYFSVSRLVWMEMGGVFAMANIRGGGEYGKEWHEGGKKLKKQNCFDDFIAAAEWLIDNKYTSNAKLAIMGGSNGGTLVGACMNQRPGLFAACIPEVGVMDMLRFHKFTIGWAWVSDYGSPDDPEEFKALYDYSPLHNLKPGTSYPATLITTADHDDRVVPAHSFKYAASLQAAHTGPAPALIRIETRAGHGGGMPTWMQIEQTADIWAFLVRVLDMEVG
ncbi:MAG: prolyl oligopeptidase family serine peptidase [Planctomycetes bacterium]|nr:prolyl oligopeptidase family serine peptidase [Planctomycetota bacterium]